MQELQTFTYGSANVRTVLIDGNPWFVLRDICTVLGITHIVDTANRLDWDEVGQTDVIDSMGRNQKTYIVNESGLYNVILRSDKPEAKPFRKWVTGEVLPSIRKHGAYMTPDVIERTLTDPDYLIQLATELKSERQRRQSLEAQAAIDAPKLETYERLAARDGLTNIRDTAKLLGIPERRFVAALEAAGLCYHDKQKKLRPYAGKGNGLFVLREYVNQKTGAHGAQTLVTFEGREYFARKFKGAEVAKL